MRSLKQILEALLFVAEGPMNAEKLLPAFEGEFKKEEVEWALKELREEYETLDRAFVIKEVAGGYQFRTKPDFSLYAVRLKKKSPNRLSRAALETLAVIAYRQPILRAEIEKLRGVDAGGVLKTLLEKDLIRIASRQDNLPGRPMLYATTNRFLETFDLPSLSALPTVEEMEKLAPDLYAETQNKLF